MENFIDVVADEDVAEGVDLHAGARGRAKDAVDGKAAVSKRIRRFHARGKIRTLRSGTRRHGRESAYGCHGVWQRDRSLRSGIQQGQRAHHRQDCNSKR